MDGGVPHDNHTPIIHVALGLRYVRAGAYINTKIDCVNRNILLLRFLNNHRQPLRTLLWRICDFIFFGNEVKDAIHAGAEEVEIHVFRSAGEEEVDFYAVAFFEPFGCFLGFEIKVVISSTHFYLHVFSLSHFRLSLGSFSLLTFHVLILAKVHQLSDGRLCIRRDLNEIDTEFFSFAQRFFKRDDSEVVSFVGNNAELGSLDLVIDANAWGQMFIS